MQKRIKKSIKKDIEKLALSLGESKIETITRLQSLCAVLKNEETLEILCSIKNDYIKDLGV